MRNTSLKRLTMSAALAFCVGAPATLSAQGKAGKDTAPAATTKPAKADDKVDISDLENKYWAPKDTDFSVVQNRTYTKENRWFLSFQYGIPVNDAYSTGSLFGVTANYFVTERQGLQLTYLKASFKNNQATDDLVNFGQSGVQPDHGRMNSYYGIGYNFVPFYAKMSFLGKKIIYFDMAFTPTIGMTTYDQLERDATPSKSAFTYGIDLTQYFFFTNYFAIRADLKNQWYGQDVVKFYNTAGGGREGDSAGNKTIHDTLFLMGLTFFY